jgi:hypothetical protein
LANLCITGLEKLKSVLLVSGNAALASINDRDSTQWKLLDEKSVLLENVPADLADQNRSVIYPAVYLYSARMENVIRRKFNGFSGPVRFMADVRCTEERYEGLERELASYVEAVMTALAGNTGPWGQNLTYSGVFTVKFEPVKLGGRNFIQSAKVELEVEACA